MAPASGMVPRPVAISSGVEQSRSNALNVRSLFLVVTALLVVLIIATCVNVLSKTYVAISYLNSIERCLNSQIGPPYTRIEFSTDKKYALERCGLVQVSVYKYSSDTVTTYSPTGINENSIDAIIIDAQGKRYIRWKGGVVFVHRFVHY